LDPDIQVHFLPFSTDKMGEKLHSFSGFSASVCQLRPESRGRSASGAPTRRRLRKIRINYPRNRGRSSRQCRGLKDVAENLAGASAPSLRDREVDPGAKGFVSDEALLSYCRARGSTIYHPDVHLPYGKRCLSRRRPAASPSRHRGPARGRRLGHAGPGVGNTNAAVIMIAEKGIRYDFGRCALARARVEFAFPHLCVLSPD